MCLSSLCRRVVFSLFYAGYAASAATEVSDSMSQGRSSLEGAYLISRPEFGHADMRAVHLADDPRLNLIECAEPRKP
jgi:hypothetical protein